nr:trypsin-like peptidase domain-containing protein [Leptolyngbyaceae cyanobacterium MAG.088]
MTTPRIDELLQQCTVKLSVPENGQVGTGFFIAPGYILTCEHVVRRATTATVGYQNNDDYGTATVEQVFAESDIALLRFEPPEALPCVLLSADGPMVGDQVSTFGYPYRYDDDGMPWKGIPALLTMEGTTGDGYLQLSLGNVLPGMSGGALLNRRTGQVCGMLKFTRDETSLMGGGGVMASTIARCMPEVMAAQRQFHQQDGRWQQLLPEMGQPNQLSINQTVDGDQTIVVGSTSGNTTIIGTQIVSPQSPGLTGIPSNLQERGSRTFVARETQTLEDLHEKLQTSQALAITALQGMGGIGKTEMAVQYAQQYKGQYPSGVCWLSARGAEVGTQLVNFAVSVLGLPQPEGELADQVRYVWNRWPRRDAGERVLLIYDDVADQVNADGEKINAYDTIKVALP